MGLVKQILTVGALSLTMMGSISVSAQNKSIHKKVKKHLLLQPMTIGFQSGRELLFNSSPLIHSKQSKVHTAVSNRLVLRKPLNAHFRVETGINYSAINAPSTTNFGYKKSGKFSVPVTLQYYFLPQQTKLKPYVGAGMQYNINPGASNISSPFIGDNNVGSIQAYQSGKKYISILFTQGMTFEVNTKIEINESFHFIPCCGNNIIGIDFGVGYKFP